MKKSAANSLLAADCLQHIFLSTFYLFFESKNLNNLKNSEEPIFKFLEPKNKKKVLKGICCKQSAASKLLAADFFINSCCIVTIFYAKK